MCKNDAATNSEHWETSEDQNREVFNNSPMISCGPMINVLPYFTCFSVVNVRKKVLKLFKKKKIWLK